MLSGRSAGSGRRALRTPPQLRNGRRGCLLALARCALRQTTQGKFAHRKSCREPVPLDDGAGAGQQDRAALPTPDIDLATIPDTAENPHLAASEPEVVTYADVDTGGVPALWCIP